MKVLVIAPHADDEIIGVGGTIAKHIYNGDDVFVCIVTRGFEPLFNEDRFEKMRSAAKECHSKLGIRKTYFLEFPAVMLEKVNRHELNGKIFEVFNETKPDIVYMPHFGDMQKDHQIVAEAVMVAVRPKYQHIVKEVYAYETLSETEWNVPHASVSFLPNMYNDIGQFLSIKLDAMSCYSIQVSDFPNPRSLEAIEALAKYRGSTACMKAAEAFMLIRKIQ